VKIVRTPTRVAGGLTDAERVRLAEHTRIWIERAFRTDPIDAAITPAIEGLYATAGLKRPRVVIVPSPVVMAFAYGAAAAIWEQRATDAATYDATDDATDAATRAATYDATYDATSAATDAATRSATYDATHAATSAATDAATSVATSIATRGFVQCSFPSGGGFPHSGTYSVMRSPLLMARRPGSVCHHRPPARHILPLPAHLVDPRIHGDRGVGVVWPEVAQQRHAGHDHVGEHQVARVAKHLDISRVHDVVVPGLRVANDDYAVLGRDRGHPSRQRFDATEQVVSLGKCGFHGFPPRGWLVLRA